MTDLVAPQTMPFLVAAGLLVLLAAVQLVGIGDMGGDADVGAGTVAPGADAGFMSALASVLGLGRLPLVAWLAVLMALFAGLGLIGQGLMASFAARMLPALPASGLALLAALPLTGLVARWLARIWPRDETTAIEIDALLARRGRILIGTAERGSPARASVRDRYGQSHNVMVEPHAEGQRFAQGAEVLLVRREGELFFAVPCDPPFLDADV